MHGGKLYNYYLIIFQFPEVCDYHEAIYAVTILDRDRIKTHQMNDMSYTGDGPLNVEVEVRDGMEMNKIFTLELLTSPLQSNLLQQSLYSV